MTHPAKGTMPMFETDAQLARIDNLEVDVQADPRTMGVAAANFVAHVISEAIANHGRARVIFATGTSQLPLFEALRAHRDVDWGKVEAFHMDEYLGLEPTHPASFRAFLATHLVEPLGIGTFHGIDHHENRAETTMLHYAQELRREPIDLVCMGVGENGHLAFNEPAIANFTDPQDVKIVELDDVSRQQQVGEGHFPNLDDVPTRAITLTIPRLLDATYLSVVVPEARKAAAIERMLNGPIDTTCPASILRTARHARLFLDHDAASIWSAS